MFYPSAIKEDATPNSEVLDAPEGVGVASPNVALEIICPQAPVKESGPYGTAGIDEGQDPDTPKEIVGSVSGDPVSHAEGPVNVVEPIQLVPPC